MKRPQKRRKLSDECSGRASPGPVNAIVKSEKSEEHVKAEETDTKPTLNGLMKGGKIVILQVVLRSRKVI